ncbi:MAG: aldo/keto reductase [Antricoccus sp.]
MKAIPQRALPERCLGALRTPALGLGAMGLSGLYGPADDRHSIELLHHAVDAGVKLFDTADVYGSGHNESLLGRALTGLRGQVQIATKTGGAAAPGVGRPERIRLAIEASLRRLQTDHVDLYYLHRVDPTVPIEDSVGAMAQLVTQGKVRHLGLSEVNAETVQKAHHIHPITAVQQEYSLFVRDSERQLFPMLRKLDIGIVAYSPLGRGILSGSMTNLEQIENLQARQERYPRFEPRAFCANMRKVEALREIATASGLTPAQLALGWLLAQGDDVVPIPGTRKLKNLKSNLRACTVILDETQIAAIEQLYPIGAMAGDRYSSALAARVQD